MDRTEMILHAPKTNQTVELVIPEGIKKIGIHLSGGADSAILLYVLCKYIKDNNLDITVLPITSCVLAKPIMIEGTFRVTNKVKELFNYDIPFLLDNFLYYRGRKIFKFESVANLSLLKEGVVDMIIAAGTSFAPEEELRKNNMWDDRPEWRSAELNQSSYEYIIPGNEKYFIYKPFNKVDKRFTAELYDQYGVRDTLFPVTKSCIAKFSKSNGWSKPCKTCWWCKERFWAFGAYDTERRTHLESIAKEVYSWDPELPPDDVNQNSLKLRLANLK
jgi:hypothetical protein